MLSNLGSSLKADEMFESADLDSVVYGRVKGVCALLFAPLSGSKCNKFKNCVWNLLLRNME